MTTTQDAHDNAMQAHHYGDPRPMHHGEPVPEREPFRAASAWRNRQRLGSIDAADLAEQLVNDLKTADRVQTYLDAVRHCVAVRLARDTAQDARKAGL